MHWSNCQTNVKRQAMHVRPETPGGDTNASTYLQTKANTLFLFALGESVLGNLSKNWIG